MGNNYFSTYLYTIFSCVATAGHTTARHTKHLHYSTSHEGHFPQIICHTSL
ncbi:hypothetical protein I79_006657 [Cricetulus griseus]|uniref:Uncharacterized protein n=1 Tax=Cricetulus griseus TaxID=10029 RepID=G3H8F7_CRIGR|nr:hypothetical protein I79_006657 [Cricetulus griseus]